MMNVHGSKSKALLASVAAVLAMTFSQGIVHAKELAKPSNEAPDMFCDDSYCGEGGSGGGYAPLIAAAALGALAMEVAHHHTNALRRSDPIAPQLDGALSRASEEVFDH